MLIEQAQTVRDQIDALETARKNESRRDDFAQRKTMLDDLVGDIAPLAKKMMVLTSYGIDIEYDGNRLEKAIEEVERVREQFEDDPQWIIQRENDLSDLKRWIQKHRDVIQRKLQSAWIDYYREQVSDLNRDLLDVLERFQDFQEPVQTVRTCTAELQDWQDEPPSTRVEFDRFAKLVEQRSKTWDRLRSEDLSEEVLDFLRDAGTEGARPEQFTDAVQLWLDENGLLDRVRIQLQS